MKETTCGSTKLGKEGFEVEEDDIRLEFSHRDAKKLPREKEISQIPRCHVQAPKMSRT